MLLAIPHGFSKAKACDKTPTGVYSEDQYIDVVTENMPDPDFNGIQAQLRVHRMGPVYAHGQCPNVHNYSVVMVHGRAAPGSPAFDLRLDATPEDPSGGRLSVQETLAWAGIDSFAPDLLGYGGSWRGPLDDPCNASLPACVALNADGTCPANAPHLVTNPVTGANDCSSVPVGCDRTRNPIFPLNQQAARPVGLGVNPGLPQCAHSSPYYFANPDVFANNILDVIDFAIEEGQPKSGKVVLLGYSFGGPSVARAIYRLGEEADRKLKRVVFLASLFNLFPGPTGPVVQNLPTEEADLPALELSTSFPLSLNGTGNWTGVGARDSFCTGRITQDVITRFWNQIMALDPLLGRRWGGNIANLYDANGELVQLNATGLLRVPTFTRNGWNPEVAATFTLPTLLLHGAEDQAALPGNSDNMFDALTSVLDKVLVKVECSSHQFSAESCEGTRCNDQDPSTTPYGQEADQGDDWKGPYQTVNAALVEWIKYGTFNASKCGSFMVNSAGIAHEIPTLNCPTP